MYFKIGCFFDPDTDRQTIYFRMTLLSVEGKMGSTVKISRIKSMKTIKKMGWCNSWKKIKMLKNIGSSEWIWKHQIDDKRQ